MSDGDVEMATETAPVVEVKTEMTKESALRDVSLFAFYSTSIGFRLPFGYS
eukprot:Pgem_evm1s15506